MIISLEAFVINGIREPRSQMETGTPYMLYKDACNKKSNQKNLGRAPISFAPPALLENLGRTPLSVAPLALLAKCCQNFGQNRKRFAQKVAFGGQDFARFWLYQKPILKINNIHFGIVL